MTSEGHGDDVVRGQVCCCMWLDLVAGTPIAMSASMFRDDSRATFPLRVGTRHFRRHGAVLLSAAGPFMGEAAPVSDRPLRTARFGAHAGHQDGME